MRGVVTIWLPLWFCVGRVQKATVDNFWKTLRHVYSVHVISLTQHAKTNKVVFERKNFICASLQVATSSWRLSHAYSAILRNVELKQELYLCLSNYLLLTQTGHGPSCAFCMWRRRTDRWPHLWPDGSGRWDNRMAAQNLSRDVLSPSSGLKEFPIRWSDVALIASAVATGEINLKKTLFSCLFA